MTPDVIMQAIGSIGFPCAMCVYVMHVTNTKIEKMTDALNELSKAIAQMEVRHNGE